MNIQSVRNKRVQFLLVVQLLLSPFFSHALQFSSGPTFTKAAQAPLSGVLALTTDEYSRVCVSINDGKRTWEQEFYDYGKTHSVQLLGFKPDRTNVIMVTACDPDGNKVTAVDPIIFITSRLPSDFPKLVLLESKPEKMEPGYTLFRLVNNDNNRAYVTVVDDAGEVVWYSALTTSLDVRQLDNGNLFIPLASRFNEVNMLGQTIKNWVAPTGWSVNIHDGIPTDRGTILYLNDTSRIVTNFPTSATDPNAPLRTTNVLCNRVIEISATNGAVLNSWSLIDMLSPARINYLSFTIRNNLGWDCQHANALIEDPRDGSLIVSMRHQDAVIKFTRSGQLKWILGPHENWGPEWQQYLLTPVGESFEWNYAQHAPMITPQGTLLIYDNGNFRASPFTPGLPNSNNYSRAVEFDIDETRMEVSQVWEYGRTNAQRLFTDRVGNADWLPKSGNVLVTFGNVNYVDGVLPSPFSTRATMLRIKEVTHDPDPEVVFDLAAFDYSNTSTNYRGTFAYRSRRIPDLYPVFQPAKSVNDLLEMIREARPSNGQSLIVSLSAALASIERSGLEAAANQLAAFQNKVLAQLAPKDPGLATELIYQAQGIIDSMTASKPAGQRHVPVAM